MRDTAFLEKEDRLPNAVRLSAICVDVMADLAGRQDAKPANQQMIGHCYRLAGSSHASLVKRNSNDKSEETRHRMAALAAYRQSADFYQKAAQDKRYTQAAHNSILMQRNVASMLIALGELQKAVEAGEKAIRMSEEGYKERKNDEARDDLASSYGIGSWYALVSRQPDKARRYAEDALRLAKGDPRKPDTYYTTLSAIVLAHALLFLGKTKEAEEIYIAVKDLQMGDRLVVDEIKNDFATLRRFDYVVPAMCKIGKLIDDKTYSQSECAAS
jgi:tetratricopeptide (TPR) repeat protein